MNTAEKAQAWLDSTTEEGEEDAAIHNAHAIITDLLAERKRTAVWTQYLEAWIGGAAVNELHKRFIAI